MPGKRDPRPVPHARTDHVPLWICGGLVLAIIVLYAQVARHAYVNLDDLQYIAENRVVLRGFSVDGVRWAFTTYQAGHWHPLTWLSHMLDVTLFGPGAAGPHLVNVALHAANAMLLFVVLRAMTAATWPAALAAALFAVHPLRVESVAWAAERKDVLSGFFWMLTLLAYAWYARRPNVARYLAVFASLALGLMAKSMLVTFPAVLLLLDLWPLGRLRGVVRDEALPPVRVAPRPAGALLLEKLPFVMLVITAMVVALRSQGSGEAVQSMARFPLAARVANAVIAYVAYVRKMLLPTDLAVFYPHPAVIHPEHLPVVSLVVAATVLIGITVLVVLALRSRPYLFVGWFWYLGTALPVIGLVQIGEQAYADRYTYIPMIGIAIALAWAVQDALLRWPRARQPVTVTLVLALTAYGFATWRQVHTWQNSVTLFEQAVRVTDDNYFAHTNLGNLLRVDNKLTDAAAHFERALQIQPSFVFALTNYGIVLEQQGRLGEALAQQQRAVELDPTSAKAHANLGSVLLRQGKFDEAITNLQYAVRQQPDHVSARVNLGAALLQQGNSAAALDQLNIALGLDPNNAEVHNNLGVALARLGRLDEARTQFELALRLNPNSTNAKRSLAWVNQRLARQ